MPKSRLSWSRPMDYPIAKTLLSTPTFMLDGCLSDANKRVFAVFNVLAKEEICYLLNVFSHSVKHNIVMPSPIAKILPQTCVIIAISYHQVLSKSSAGTYMTAESNMFLFKVFVKNCNSQCHGKDKGNGLVLNRCQAITWTNADLILWHIYVARVGLLRGRERETS